jgi:hypothetical protein
MGHKKLWLGMLVMVFTFGMTAVGCDSGNNTTGNNKIAGGDDDENLPYPNDIDEDLPDSNGNNAVSGKTYFIGDTRLIFSVTTEDIINGTYAIKDIESGIYRPDDNNRYIDIETGIYSWNEEAKTVTLKPEKVSFLESKGSSGGDGYFTINNKYEILEDKTAYHSRVLAYLEFYKDKIGNVAFNKLLSYHGFTNTVAFVDYTVNEVFVNKTNRYSFSSDGTALFLERLPVNRGINEFSGQLYYGKSWIWDEEANEEILKKDKNQTYVFTDTHFTLTFEYSEGRTITIPGTYAYNSIQKRIWLMPSSINGLDRAAYYAAQSAPSKHWFEDDNTYHARLTNEAFNYWEGPYNRAEKTISDWKW